jgi:hypothetical protein
MHSNFRDIWRGRVWMCTTRHPERGRKLTRELHTHVDWAISLHTLPHPSHMFQFSRRHCDPWGDGCLIELMWRRLLSSAVQGSKIILKTIFITRGLGRSSGWLGSLTNHLQLPTRLQASCTRSLDNRCKTKERKEIYSALALSESR